MFSYDTTFSHVLLYNNVSAEFIQMAPAAGRRGFFCCECCCYFYDLVAFEFDLSAFSRRVAVLLNADADFSETWNLKHVILNTEVNKTQAKSKKVFFKSNYCSYYYWNFQV